MNKFTAAIFITSFIATLSYAAQTPGNSIKVYKWVDANGITHYDQTPPANTPKDVIKLSKTASSDESSSTDNASSTAATEKKTSKSSSSASTTTAPKVKDKERCEIARKNAETLKTYTHIKVKGDDGEFRYLSQEEQQQKIEEVDKAISESCE